MTDKNVNPDDNQADDNQAGENVEERFADIVDGVDIDADQPAADSQAPEEMSREAQLEALLAERTEDLQRLQAEYVNYKRRVDRDRALSRQSGVDKVITDLMPVLDS
ncbi:MAG: nucleotide exchange factor GrpE, partial [Cutibacterium avidum]|nr:nucleotide exchange factor GrpE [Paeniclostridium sordellii]MDU6252226.1 nucleotide exchange factor GrpE [Cutibacterium avidum]